jgi:hypothetical protein
MQLSAHFSCKNKELTAFLDPWQSACAEASLGRLMSDDDEIPVDTRGAAKRLNLSESFLNKQRSSGGGPPYVQAGRRILYRPADLRAWLASRVRKSTSDGPRDGRDRRAAARGR